MSVADRVLILVDSVGGVGSGNRNRDEITRQNLNPAMFMVINKMDRENASFQKALASVQEQTTTA
jgi:translation elongation factor EF-G